MTEAEYKRSHQDDLSELERLALELNFHKAQLERTRGWLTRYVKATQQAEKERDAALADAKAWRVRAEELSARADAAESRAIDRCLQLEAAVADAEDWKQVSRDWRVRAETAEAELRNARPVLEAMTQVYGGLLRKWSEKYQGPFRDACLAELARRAAKGQ